MRKRVAVVGGGIAGLAAAVRLRDRAPAGTDIIVYEQSGQLGGKLRTGELAGTPLERCAESFLTGAPDGNDSAVVALARRVGLGDDFIHPAALPAALAISGRLEPIPPGTLLGIPAAGDDPSRDQDTGKPLLADGEDVSVGALVRSRYGDDIVDRLVDPLLGGVYAGRADTLSLAATMPALARTARTEHTLARAVEAAKQTHVRVPGRPMFAAIDGGLSRLVGAAAAAAGARISLGLPVHAIAPYGTGWRLALGPVAAPQYDEVDAVVVAVPATPAARLIEAVRAEAAELIGVLEYASIVLVAMALPADTVLPELSGFLVPPSEGTLLKAATFVSRKWPRDRPADAPVLVRVSLGRSGEQERLQRADDVLAAQAHLELAALLRTKLGPALESWVQRWGGCLPQYAPGHLDRVAAARALLPPGIALAGAAFDGVGIPACVASGEQAADTVVTYLEN